jgi:hypothetical protein
VISAHLNGGPKDDIYWTVESHTWRIAGMTRLSPALASDGATLTELPVKIGRYEMRRDVFGQPVPHNLEGVVEFDWKGWE